MGSFVRIDGEEIGRIDTARFVWHPARSGSEHGLGFHLIAHGRNCLLHVAAWAPGEHPGDLSGQEVTIGAPGADAALDGRLFSALLVRFGRVDAESAVLSIDGEIEGLHELDARSLVAADVHAAVSATQIPAYCDRCGRPLADEAEPTTNILGGRRVTTHRPRPRCRACAAEQPLAPPERCPACGEHYQDGSVSWQADELTLAYTATCPRGHAISAASSVREEAH